MDDRVPGEIEARRAAAIEERDLSGVANAEERPLQRHRIVHAQGTNLCLGQRRSELVSSHARG